MRQVATKLSHSLRQSRQYGIVTIPNLTSLALCISNLLGRLLTKLSSVLEKLTKFAYPFPLMGPSRDNLVSLLKKCTHIMLDYSLFDYLNSKVKERPDIGLTHLHLINFPLTAHTYHYTRLHGLALHFPKFAFLLLFSHSLINLFLLLFYSPFPLPKCRWQFSQHCLLFSISPICNCRLFLT